jgi:hypothetical protein
LPHIFAYLSYVLHIKTNALSLDFKNLTVISINYYWILLITVRQKMIEPYDKSIRSIDFTLIVNIYTCWPHVDQ